MKPDLLHDYLDLIKPGNKNFVNFEKNENSNILFSDLFIVFNDKLKRTIATVVVTGKQYQFNSSETELLVVEIKNLKSKKNNISRRILLSEITEIRYSHINRHLL